MKWTWSDDGHGDEVTPEEPGKRWITLYDGEEEAACLVWRTGLKSSDERAAYCLGLAPEMVEALNGADALRAELARMREAADAMREALASASVLFGLLSEPHLGPEGSSWLDAAAADIAPDDINLPIDLVSAAIAAYDATREGA